MLTYEKAISDLIEKFDESGVYLSDQNRWAVDVAFGAMIGMAKELDGTLEKEQKQALKREYMRGYDKAWDEIGRG